MKTKNRRSFIAWLAIAAIAGEIAARAVILPVQEDTSSTAAGSITALGGKATSLSVSATRQAFVRFDLSALSASTSASTVSRARLTFYITAAAIPAGLTVHAVTSDWHEKTSTIGKPAFAGAVASVPIGQVAGKQFIVVDVTDTVTAWLNGAANDGFAIVAASGSVTLASKEGAATGYPATLEIEDGVTSDGKLRVTGTGLAASLDLVPFNEDPNDPQTRIQATDDGGFGAHLDFMTKPIGAAANTLAARMRIMSTGNVGIGTLTPDDPLQIGSFGSGDQYLSIKSAGGNRFVTGIKFRHFNDTGGFDITDSEHGTNNGLSFIRYPFDVPATAMFIDRFTGNVGIGTISPAFQLVVGSSGSPAYCNGTTWVNGSDRNSKEAFAPINPRAVLEKVTALSITEWKYKVEADGTRHLGPVAQDFHAAFGLNGADDKHIATVDEEGVALAAIQGLNEKVEEKSRENALLKEQLAEMDSRMKAIEALLAAPRGAQAK